MQNKHTPLLFLDIETVAEHAHFKELSKKSKSFGQKIILL